MLITRALLLALDTQSPTGLNRFAAAFPNGADMQGEPDPMVVDRLAMVPLDVPALAKRVLTARAYDAYDAANEAAYGAFKSTTLEAGGRLGHEEYARVLDSALHALRCAQVRALWGIVRNTENVAESVR